MTASLAEQQTGRQVTGSSEPAAGAATSVQGNGSEATDYTVDLRFLPFVAVKIDRLSRHTVVT